MVSKHQHSIISTTVRESSTSIWVSVLCTSSNGIMSYLTYEQNTPYWIETSLFPQTRHISWTQQRPWYAIPIHLRFLRDILHMDLCKVGTYLGVSKRRGGAITCLSHTPQRNATQRKLHILPSPPSSLREWLPLRRRRKGAHVLHMFCTCLEHKDKNSALFFSPHLMNKDRISAR